MKIFRLLLGVTILALLFTFTVSSAIAGGMGNGAAQRMRLVVASVDTTAGTIELKSLIYQAAHTYKIDATTKVMVGNAKGTIDQITTGQKVQNFAAEGHQLPKDGETLTLIWLSQAGPAMIAPATPANP